MKQLVDKHEWFVRFTPRHRPREFVVDEEVLVVIDDKTGEAKVYYGA